LKQLLVIDWRQKAGARAQLKLAIEDVLDTLPEAYDRPLYAQKCRARLRKLPRTGFRRVCDGELTADRDVAWLFLLLPFCPMLRVLLVDGGLRVTARGETGTSVFVHEVCESGRGTITEQIIKNLRLHRRGLRGRIGAGD